MFEGIRHRLFRAYLRQRLKAVSQIERSLSRYDNISNIGLLFDASRTDRTMMISNWAETIRKEGKKVDLLGYKNFNVKEGKEDFVFDTSDINWVYVPTSDGVKRFMNTPYDILFAVIEEECLPMEYIAAGSKAHFRVTPFIKGKTYCGDLMIKPQSSNDYKHLLNQMMQYTKEIRND